MPVVWIDGGLRDPSTAGLHWSDHGITVGDGVFETLKLAGGAPFALTRHLDRLARSAEGLRLLPPPPEVLRAAADEVAAAWGDRPGRLRITLTAGRGPMGSSRGTEGPTLMVTAGDMTVQRDPTDVVVVPMTRNERGALAGLKTTSYAENVLALALAEEAGASEAILANTRGELCEGTGANVVVGFAGSLRTPPLDSGCLAGVTRALLLEAMAAAGHPVAEEALSIDDLHRAEEAFLLSTGREVQPIRAVDGRALPFAPGPLTERATAVWDAAYGEAVDP
jgi:branched-chain amino acid aminotransferase